MKKIVFFIIALNFLFSCKNEQQELLITTTDAVSVSVKKDIINLDENEYLSKIDTSKISTFSDYYEVKQRLFSEYYTLKQNSFSTYYEGQNKSFSDYYDLQQSEIILLRQENKSLYLEWLDAKEIGDYERQKNIEEKPEFRKYLSKSNKAYKKHQHVTDSLYKLHQKIERNSYKEYQEKERLAYSVHRSKQ